MNLTTENKEKLQKIYKDAGNLSIILSFFGVVFSALLGIGKYTPTTILIGAAVMFLLTIPFIFFGKKLKEKGIDDIQYAFKISRSMFIYTIIFIGFNLLFGGVGFLWLFLLYYFFKSYRETKKFLK